MSGEILEAVAKLIPGPYVASCPFAESAKAFDETFEPGPRRRFASVDDARVRLDVNAEDDRRLRMATDVAENAPHA